MLWSFLLQGEVRRWLGEVNIRCINPLKRNGVKWLHFEVFIAIQV